MVIGEPTCAPASCHGELLTDPKEGEAMELCDRCGARAYLSVLTSKGPLLFCRHHGRAHAKALSDGNYPATTIAEGDGEVLVVDYATL